MDNSESVKYKLAEKIKARLVFLRISRKKFSEIMNIHQSMVTKWLSGNQNFTMDTLTDIGLALNIQLIDLEIDETYYCLPCAPCNYFYNSHHPIQL